jgi:hypothetical protein
MSVRRSRACTRPHRLLLSKYRPTTFRPLENTEKVSQNNKRFFVLQAKYYYSPHTNVDISQNTQTTGAAEIIIIIE